MELWQLKVEARVRHDLTRSGVPSVLVMPLGDVQYGSQDCDVRMLRDHVQWGAKQQVYWIGLGDDVDFASPSNRARLEAAGLYDATRDALDGLARTLMDELYTEALSPTAGRWLGRVHGHHRYIFQDGISSDMYLAEKLRAPYLGSLGIIALQFDEGIVEIWVHHGSGAPQTLGALPTKLQRMHGSWPSVHIFLVGHSTQLFCHRLDRILTSWRRGHAALEHVSVALVGTGGFMRGYALGRKQGPRPEGSYVEQRGLIPTSLGGPLIQIAPRTRGGLFIPDIQVVL